MHKLVFIFSIFYFWQTFAVAGLWKLKTTVEFVDPKETKFKIKKSVLNFQSGNGDKKVYSPKVLPWGLYKSKEVVSGGQTFFITYWAAGSQNVHFKIFNPSVSANPLCEFTSDAEETRLRHVKGVLEYEWAQYYLKTQTKDER